MLLLFSKTCLHLSAHFVLYSGQQRAWRRQVTEQSSIQNTYIGGVFLCLVRVSNVLRLPKIPLYIIRTSRDIVTASRTPAAMIAHLRCVGPSSALLVTSAFEECSFYIIGSYFDFVTRNR